MKAHLIIISLFITGSISIGQAQIIYTDINPDSTFIASLQDPWAMYQLDLNNDGSQDFTITHFHPSANLFIVEMNCSQYGECEVLTDANGIPKALNKNDLIDAQQSSWYNSYANAMHMSDNWKGMSDKILGLRILKNSNWYYGWTRLDVPADETFFTIKDYAYQSSPGLGLKAGETTGGTGIPFRQAAETKIIPQNNILLIERGDQPNSSELLMYNLAGVKLASYTIDAPVCSIDLTAFRSGLYFIELRNLREYLFKKIIIRR